MKLKKRFLTIKFLIFLVFLMLISVIVNAEENVSKVPVLEKPMNFIQNSYIPFSIGLVRNIGILVFGSCLSFVRETYIPKSQDLLIDLGNFIYNGFISFLVVVIIVSLIIIIALTRHYSKDIISQKLGKKVLEGKQKLERLKQLSKAGEERARKLEEKKIKQEKIRFLQKEKKKEYASDLKSYFLRALERGLSEEEIKDALIRQAWPEKIVEKYCNIFFEKNKTKIIRIKKRSILQQQLESLERALDKNREYLGKELPKKWMQKKPVKKIELREHKEKEEKEIFSEDKISELQQEADLFEELLEKNKEYFEKELSRKWERKVPVKRLVVKEPIKRKVPEKIKIIYEDKINELQKESDFLDRALEKNIDYIKEELPKRYSVSQRIKKLLKQREEIIEAINRIKHDLEYLEEEREEIESREEELNEKEKVDRLKKESNYFDDELIHNKEFLEKIPKKWRRIIVKKPIKEKKKTKTVKKRRIVSEKELERLNLMLNKVVSELEEIKK